MRLLFDCSSAWLSLTIFSTGNQDRCHWKRQEVAVQFDVWLVEHMRLLVVFKDAKVHFLGDNDYTVWILYFLNFEDFVTNKKKKQLMNKTKWARRVSWITFFGYAQSQKIGKPNKLSFGATKPTRMSYNLDKLSGKFFYL
jgi:hypothetical protein